MLREIKLSRIACFFVAIAMICSTLSPTIPIYANTKNDFVNQDSIAVYSNSAISDCSISISGITATCNVKVKSQKSRLTKVTMELQKKKSSGYKTVETWSSSKTGTNLSFSEKRNINILCTYRLKATITVGGETHILYAYQK